MTELLYKHLFFIKRHKMVDSSEIQLKDSLPNEKLCL